MEILPSNRLQSTDLRGFQDNGDSSRSKHLGQLVKQIEELTNLYHRLNAYSTL